MTETEEEMIALLERIYATREKFDDPGEAMYNEAGELRRLARKRAMEIVNVAMRVGENAAREATTFEAMTNALAASAERKLKTDPDRAAEMYELAKETSALTTAAAIFADLFQIATGFREVLEALKAGELSGSSFRDFHGAIKTGEGKPEKRDMN